MAIKSIFCGKSKNLCDVSHLITLPVDKSFNGYGFWEVEINVEPDTVYTFSRENANQINVGGATYLGITNQYGIPNGGSPNQWLNHETLSGLCHQNVQITSNTDGKLWIFFSVNVYNKWQNYENPFGYLQLEKGSIATEYVPHELTSYKSIMKVSDVCQLVDISKYQVKSGTTNGISWQVNQDGSITVNGTCTKGFPLNPNNTHFVCDQTHIYFAFPYTSINYAVSLDGTLQTGEIVKISTSAFPTNFNTVIWSWMAADATFNNYVIRHGVCDLTEMFGAGNEPKTVAEFKAKFPNDYYPYSPSCFVTSFDERMPCKTKNLFDKSNADIISREYYFTPNQDAGSNFYVMTVKPGITYTVTYERFIKSTDTDSHNALELSVQTGTHYKDGTQLLFRVGNGERGVWVKRSGQFTIPSDINQVTFSGLSYRFLYLNFMVQEGTTATDYVPYGYV